MNKALKNKNKINKRFTKIIIKLGEHKPFLFLEDQKGEYLSMVIEDQ